MYSKLRRCPAGRGAAALERRHSDVDRLGDRTGGLPRASLRAEALDWKGGGISRMKRSAQAQWQGDLKSGTGTISTASGTLANTPYSFHSRFEQGRGTNPEELLAAAHAGCF